MSDISNASNTILDFLTLLEVEQAKETSDLFNAAIWQDLNQLNLDLNAITKPNKIALEILDWCEKYPEIYQLFKSENWQKDRCDMVGEEDDIPLPSLDSEAEIIRNRDKIQKIIQENQQPPNPDSPTNPEQD